MLTNEDIQNLIRAEKEVFATKDDVSEVKQSIGVLTSSVDAYAKKTDTYHQEMAVLIHKLHRVEEWIRQVAEKVGVKYA